VAVSGFAVAVAVASCQLPIASCQAVVNQM